MEFYKKQLHKLSIHYQNQANLALPCPEIVEPTYYDLSPYINTQNFYKTQITSLSNALKRFQQTANPTNHVKPRVLQDYLETEIPSITGYPFVLAENKTQTTNLTPTTIIPLLATVPGPLARPFNTTP